MLGNDRDCGENYYATSALLSMKTLADKSLGMERPEVFGDLGRNICENIGLRVITAPQWLHLYALLKRASFRRF